MVFPQIHSAEDMAKLVNDAGFLPFFRNEIEGFSIEDITPPSLWFSDTEDGPWEWKGPVIALTGGAYGKFFRGKAMFVSRQWFAHFANYRRDGYDFDSRVDEGLVRAADERVYGALERLGPSLSKRLKAYVGYGGEAVKGFDGVMTRLEMGGYVVTADFEYMHDASGKRYGWGVAKYATVEQFFGEEFRKEMYAVRPSESYEMMFEHLRALLPSADEASIRRLLG